MLGSSPEDDGAMNIYGETIVCEIEAVVNPSIRSVEPCKSLVCAVASPL